MNTIRAPHARTARADARSIEGRVARRRVSWLTCATLVAAGLTACGGGGGSDKNPSNPTGKVVDKPGGGFFFADPNQAGNAQEPRITRQMFGRLVEVFGLDDVGNRVPMASTYVIQHSLVPDGQTYLLETNPVTTRQSLIILRDVTDTAPGGGLAQFLDRMYQAGANLTPIFEAAADGAGLYSMVPRNATVVVQFDDLIDSRTLTPITFRVKTGNPPVLPFEGRVFMDPNFGDLADHDGDGADEFHSTRILFDSTVTEIESFENDPPLPINGVGLPPAVDVNLANFEMRVPTKLDVTKGQNKLLRNPSGHAITSSNNGPVDFGSSTQDVVRAARSGGPTDVTADPYNGFLPDDEPPILVGQQPTFVAAAPQSTNGFDEFVLPSVVFDSVFCSQTPEPGDVIAQPGIFAQILQKPVPVQNGQLTNVQVRLILWPTAWDEPPLSGPLEWLTAAVGDAQFLAAFDPVADADRQACFARVTPLPAGFPSEPAVGLSTSATLGVRFSEPMDPTSLTAFDSVTLTRKPFPEDEDDALATSDYIVGSLTQSLDLQEFTFIPDLPLAHESAAQESYYLTVAAGQLGPSDLAGNALAFELPTIEFTLDPSAVPQLNGGRVSRFTGQDEEPPFGDETGPKPEWTGQHLYDLQRQLIRPRPVVHFQSVADRSKPVPQLMTQFAPGVQTPLSSLGSKMQTLWRYVDYGFSLLDETNHNLDVEGLYWSPVGGSVTFDAYQEFEISIAHCKWAPDEYIDPGSLFPTVPNSGLGPNFNSNFMNADDDPPKIVHEKFRGYQLQPGDVSVHPVSGTKLMPFPWNRDVSQEEWKTWTWRNTALRDRAGPKTTGVDPLQLYVALGLTAPCNFYYREERIRTIGLPMLVEFRCYPDDGASGVNAFDISLASNSSSKPYFRAFSTGGVDDGGNLSYVDPDTESKANGGFNPTSNPPGAGTHGLDNTFYIGAADFVVRISRTHSIWFGATNPLDETGGTFASTIYMDPVIEPRAEDQPDGTKITLAFRGAKNHVPTLDNCTLQEDNLEWLEDATSLDMYGDHYEDDCLENPDTPCAEAPNHNPNNENLGVKWFGPGKNDIWYDSISGISGAKYYQVRITFQSDIFTGLTPELSALAVSWIGFNE